MTASGWSPTDPAYQAQLLRARAALAAPDGNRSARPVRAEVLASWRRCLDPGPDPGPGGAARSLDTDDSLRRARRRHVFHEVLPMLRSRLIDPAVDAGLVVALGDARGRLLWVEARGRTASRAAAMGFAAGADWSEAVMGTSAPALAVRAGTAAQVVGAEHFREVVHPWSCSAVPLLDPRSGTVLGVLDVTGDDDAVSPLVLPLLRATATAVQEQLAAQAAPSAPVPAPGTLLRVTGLRAPRLVTGAGTRELSVRHAELLLLLSLHPEGIGAAELAESLHGTAGAEGTVRAELVRLRRVLGSADVAPGLRIDSRPYRLHGPLGTDLDRTRAALEAGDVERVLADYHGEVLPASEAPGVRTLRERTRATVRELVLSRGSSRQLWAYAQLTEAKEDLEVLTTLLRIAPPDAPERVGALVRAEDLAETVPSA